MANPAHPRWRDWRKCVGENGEKYIDANNWFARVWRSELERAGLRYIPPDMLRHTSETLMQAARLPDTLVSRLHGHTDLQTDYRHYLRPGAEQAEDAARAVHRIMGE